MKIKNINIKQNKTSDNTKSVNEALDTASNLVSINPDISRLYNSMNSIASIGNVPSYYDYNRKAPDGDLIEFKLTDGTKIIKEIIWGRIENIVEKINPEKNNKKYVIMDYIEKDGSIKSYEIDCNFSMFMKLIGKKYKPWNQMVMTESVKNGNLVIRWL